MSPSLHGGRLMGLAIGLMLIAVPDASAHHLYGHYEGADAQGSGVGFDVKDPVHGSFLQGFGVTAVGTTDLGQPCTPIYPPSGEAIDIVDHAFSDTISEDAPIKYTLTMSGSFSAPRSASGTARVTSDEWTPPPGHLPAGSTCDTGTVSWTASCVQMDAPPSPCSAVEDIAPVVFSGSASPAKVLASGRVTVPVTIVCRGPGADCLVSVVARARVTAGAAAKLKQVKLGRSHYRVKANSSAKTRFKLTKTGRRLLRSLGRIKAKVRITVNRGTSVTKKTVTVRLKAPKRL